jgi:uncharacterized protein (TIGR03437 family)
VAVDSAGNLFIADTGNHRIREVSAQTGVISTVAGNGQPGYGGDQGPATRAQLQYPSGVAVDKAGNIYIADSNNQAVRKVSASTGLITTIADLTEPLGVAVDSAGNVFVVDGARVAVLIPSSGSGCAYAVTSSSIQPSPFGGSVTVGIQTTAYCPWTIDGLPNWITISGPSAGLGPGNVTLTVAANTNGTRGATLSIGGVPVPVSQAEISTASGPAIASVVNAEGGLPTIAPNTWVEIDGYNLAPAGDARQWTSADFVNGQMPQQLDGVGVTVNGKPAYVYYISSGQVNILTPPDGLSGSVAVQLTNNGVPSLSCMVRAQAVNPSFFVFQGGPYVVATHLDGRLVGPASLYPGQTTPIQPGETFVLYGNGFGQVSTPVVSGAGSQVGSLAVLPVVTIGGVVAQVTFAGLSGVPGEFQFNVVAPSTLSSGDQQIAASYNGFATPVGTLLTVQ